MPLKGQAKLDYQKKWRKEKIRTGYGKWLYKKRALRWADAEEFRAALEQIAKMPTSEHNPDGDEQAAHSMQTVAEDALAASEERWAELEKPISISLRGQATSADDTLLEAIEKLGLTQ